MSYIAPNSDVYLLKGVNLDSDYSHTIRQSSAESQYVRMRTYNKYYLTDQSYQRVGKNKIRVGILADNLYDCNYMMFRNTSFGNKWFYAFIKGVEYINNNVTEIEYAIDYMQTWYFDYELGECFVEREHASTDEIGDNIVPENLETGEMISVGETMVESPRLLGGIVLKKPLQGWWFAGNDYCYYFDCQYNLGKNQIIDPPMGIPFGLNVIYGFPISDKDVNDYWNGYSNNYNMQDPLTYHADHNTPYVGMGTYVTLGKVINGIANDMFHRQLGDEGDWSINDIADVFIYPAEFNLKANMTRASNAGMKNFSSYAPVNASGRPTAFFSTINTSDIYYPKNNKLYTFPFVQLKLSNNRGGEMYYRYEDFVDSDQPKFSWYGYCMSNAMWYIVPSSYKGVRKNYDNGMVLSNFPVPAYEGSQYASWNQANKNTYAMSLLSTAINGATSVMGSVGKMNTVSGADATSIVSSGTRTALAIGSQIAQVGDIMNVPAQVAGQIGNDAMNTAMNRTGFHFYSLAIKAEYAKIIDEYLSMYGYATHRVKVPNVASATPVRERWEYVKTMGCIIHPKTGKGLPSEDEKEIAKIYDKGITFWVNMNEVGNYSLSNGIMEETNG